MDMGYGFTQIKRLPGRGISINHPGDELDHIVNVLDGDEVKTYVSRKGDGQIRLK
jgi:hypothetical protein